MRRRVLPICDKIISNLVNVQSIRKSAFLENKFWVTALAFKVSEKFATFENQQGKWYLFMGKLNVVATNHKKMHV